MKVSEKFRYYVLQFAHANWFCNYWWYWMYKTWKEEGENYIERQSWVIFMKKISQICTILNDKFLTIKINKYLK